MLDSLTLCGAGKQPLRAIRRAMSLAGDMGQAVTYVESEHAQGKVVVTL